MISNVLLLIVIVAATHVNRAGSTTREVDQVTPAIAAFEQWFFRYGDRPSDADVKAVMAARDVSDAAAMYSAISVSRGLASVDGVPDQYALETLRRLSDNGYAPAMTLLGTIYREGKVPGHTAADGLDLIQKAYKAGDSNAALQLGQHYSKGLYGFEVDLMKAREYLREARFKGIERGIVDEAVVAEKLGDKEEARERIEQAASLGDAQAQVLLLRSLIEGRVYPRDLRRATALARQWHERNPYAAGVLGQIYLTHPEATATSGNQILTLLRTGANAGDVNTALDLADALLYGVKEEAPKPSSAVTVLEKLSQTGSSEASYRLGLIHLQGLVAPGRHLSKAREHLEHAAQLQHQRAVAVLRLLDEAKVEH